MRRNLSITALRLALAAIGLAAAAIVYAIPPMLIYYALRRRMSGALTMGGVKG